MYGAVGSVDRVTSQIACNCCLATSILYTFWVHNSKWLIVRGTDINYKMFTTPYKLYFRSLLFILGVDYRSLITRQLLLLYF